jgi:hypothetical protein
MGVEIKKIEDVIESAKVHGHDVSIRDVIYSYVRVRFDNDLMIYTALFGIPKSDQTIPEYEVSDSVKYLINYFKRSQKNKEKEKAQEDEMVARLLEPQSSGTGQEQDITFEENKSAMIALIERVEEGIADGKIEPDKGLKIIADIRVKLNDKFNTQEENKSSVYIMPAMYDLICPHTHRECYQMTKEYAMKQFDLIEKK